MDHLVPSPLSLPTYKTVNVIVSTRANREIDIETLAEKLFGSVYEPEVFPGLIYRMTGPTATIIIFATGKITSIGTKSDETARKTIDSVATQIGKIEGKISLGKITTENVVATFNVGFQIDLKRVPNCLIKSIYEPGKFPGVIHRPRSKVVVMIFKSGKLVTVGSKSESEAKSVLTEAYQKLKECGCCTEEK